MQATSVNNRTRINSNTARMPAVAIFPTPELLLDDSSPSFSNGIDLGEGPDGVVRRDRCRVTGAAAGYCRDRRSSSGNASRLAPPTHAEVHVPNEVVQSTDSDHAVVTRSINAPPEAVWAVLADGWLYANWVVGASRIRDVEPEWPRTGSRIHHSFGLWPLLIDDHTRVLESVENKEMLLVARGWPAGEAHVRITLAAERANHTSVSIVEDATAGPGKLIPQAVRQLVIGPRNKETLQRLALLAEGRYREGLTGN